MRRKYTLTNAGYTAIQKKSGSEAVSTLIEPALEIAQSVLSILYPHQAISVYNLHNINDLPRQLFYQDALFCEKDNLSTEALQADAVILLHYGKLEDNAPQWRMDMDFLNLGKTPKGKLKYIALSANNKQFPPVLYLQVYHLQESLINRILISLTHLTQRFFEMKLFCHFVC